MIPISAQDLIGSSHILYIDKNPDRCPICQTKISAELITSRITQNSPGSLLQAVFQCTNNLCERLFLAFYTYTEDNSTAIKRLYKLNKTSRVNANETFFSEKVRNISPDFVNIYNQALIAEFINLNDLKGIGLRKSLEMLIKDFAFSEFPDRSEEIKKMSLAQCITGFLDEKIVKELMKRASWIESDESPLKRKWNKSEVKELELIIRLTANWIDYELSTNRSSA